MMPRPVIMPIANDKRRSSDRTEAIRILKLSISNIPKSVSPMVAAHANDTVHELGKRDVTTPVYSTKSAKFPQDTFFAPYGPHKPKRSATADRKEAPSANRANRRTISVPFSLSCAAFEFIRADGQDPKSKEISWQRPFNTYFLRRGSRRPVYCSVEKLMHQRPNPIHFFFQREMARVEKMELCTGNISFIEFSTLHRKDSIVFAPSD